MIEESNAKHFTFDVPTLTTEEEKVQEFLFSQREELLKDPQNFLLKPFYEIKDTNLTEIFKKMPKGGYLHLHVEEAFSEDYYLNITREDNVYFSFQENKFKVFDSGDIEPTYNKCNDIRRDWDQEGTFDDYVLKIIKFSNTTLETRNTHKIWLEFQHKFQMISGMIRYPKYFRRGLMDVCANAIKDNVSIIELRNELGTLINTTVEEELEMYQSVIKEVKAKHPYFEVIVIVEALKITDTRVRTQLEYYMWAKEKYYFVKGFDLVAEEDAKPPLYHYKDLLLEAKKNATKQRYDSY